MRALLQYGYLTMRRWQLRMGASEVSPEQRMLFNEAEVLAAIEAAHANRTTSIKSHDRQHPGGRKALPKNSARKQIPWRRTRVDGAPRNPPQPDHP
jgi:hypothetical protein